MTDRLPRAVKGGRPAFHAEPAIDRLIQMVMALTSEVSVLSDRLATVQMLAKVPLADVESFVPDLAERNRREARREALLQRILASLETELDELESLAGQDRYWDEIRRIETGDA